MFGLQGAEFGLLVLLGVLANAVPLVLFVVVMVLAIRWFLRQERSSKDPEVQHVRRSLSEVLRARREHAHMTQELVAQELGVSRQTVGKWESGRSEPSTSNLVRLARLYGTDAAELLREVGVTTAASGDTADSS